MDSVIPDKDIFLCIKIHAKGNIFFNAFGGENRADIVFI